MAAPKLSDSLATNVPMLVIMHKRGKSYPNKFKPGEFNYMYIFHDEAGKEFAHFATTREEEILKLFQPGEKLQVIRKEMQGDSGRYYFNEWTTTEGVEARSAATPQLQGNVAQETAKKHQDRREDDERARQTSIILQAFTKSWIEGGVAKTPEQADALARTQYELHKQAVLDFLNI